MIGICTVSVATGALSTVMPSADVADEASGMAAATVLATELAVVMSTLMITLAAETVTTMSLLLAPVMVAKASASFCLAVASMSETSPAAVRETVVL